MSENEIRSEVDRRIELFTLAVEKYQKNLNLLNWEIKVSSQYCEDVRASVYFDISGRIATIYYSVEWIDDNITDEEINKVAFHEVAELLYAKFNCLLGSFFSEDVVNEAIHDHIRLLENILLKKLI